MSRAQPSGLAALLSDYRHYAGRQLWLALALMLFGALAEGFGLLMIVPLASIALGSDAAKLERFAPFAVGWSTDQRLIVSLSLFVAAMAARSALLFARDRQLSALATGYESDLKLRAASTLAGRGWPFASGIGQDGMQALLLTDVPRAAQAITYLQNAALSAAMMGVALALTLTLSPRLTLVALFFLVLAGVAFMRSARRSAASGHAISAASDAATGSGFRLHSGLKAALAQGTVEAFLREYESTLDESSRQVLVHSSDYARSRQLAVFGAALVAAVLMLVGIRFLHVPLPVLLASLILFARMSGPAQLIQSSLINAAAFAPAFAAIEARLGPLTRDPVRSPEARPRDWRELKLAKVSHLYRPGQGLPTTSLTIRVGEWIGIRGPSGTGKTTLVDIAAALLSPQSGMVTLDGQPLSGADLDGWRAAIAYVGQDGTVFNDSVRGNLLAEGAEADNVELWQALETTGLAARIRAYPDGLNQQVGDRGSQLSGGERQRLVLARALLRRPSLLILDESTAALDPDAERDLFARLRAMVPRPAALIVAHRDSTLSHCDSVVTIQHGTM